MLLIVFLCLFSFSCGVQQGLCRKYQLLKKIFELRAENQEGALHRLESANAWEASNTSPDILTKFYNSIILSESPLLIKIQKFLPDNVCDDIISTAVKEGLFESTVLNSKDSFVGRSSTTVWLRDEKVCSGLSDISEKVALLSQQPISHQENLQVIRYEVNQEYTLHTDHIEEFNELECGGRFATCLIYLNDDFEGGETNFPELGLTVIPEKGTAIFWYNVLPFSDPWKLMPEMKLLHAGLPVHQGVKWACNKWVHLVPMP